jgi:hypothetical protein
MVCSRDMHWTHSAPQVRNHGGTEANINRNEYMIDVVMTAMNYIVLFTTMTKGIACHPGWAAGEIIS